MDRGLNEHLAREVARELTEKDVVRAHARDELGIDIDAMANPFQVGCGLISVQVLSLGRGIRVQQGFTLGLCMY